MKPKFQILLYYKYIHIENPTKLLKSQKVLCQSLGLKGRVIIAPEGINGTLEGTLENTEKYISEMVKDKRFTDIQFKKSEGTGYAFPKLSIKVRTEIVAGHLGKDDVNPSKVTGKYIYAEELHEWINSKKEFYIVDMRNDFEQKSGFFEGSVLSGFSEFRDLPKIIPKLRDLPNKPIVTVCTGGVRCEKASGFLIENGFKDVYQLYGGIVTYMEKYPNQDFKGKLYVFDQRVVMGFNTDSPEHEVVGRCMLCQKQNDHYVNCANDLCHLHFIACLNCCDESGKAFCSEKCRNSIISSIGGTDKEDMASV